MLRLCLPTTHPRLIDTLPHLFTENEAVVGLAAFVHE